MATLSIRYKTAKIFSLEYWMRFIRFNIVGLTGIFVNEGLLVLLTAKGFHYIVAGAFAVEASIISNFVLHDCWTFKDRRSGHVLTRLIKFNGLMLIGLVINLAVMYVLTDFFGLHYTISNLAGIAVATIARYAMSIRWTWYHEAETDKDEPITSVSDRPPNPDLVLQTC